jgi:hypothetical protein
MKSIHPILLILSIIVCACGGEISAEKKPLVDAVNFKVRNIDRNHRVEIVEDDFSEGDSVYKIRAYYFDQYLVKLIGVMRTPHFEREDFFYFENHAPIFSGHLINERDDHLAAEYKYYYNGDKIDEALFWEDHYTPGEKFPHEKFAEFSPDMDSLMTTEKERIKFLLTKIELEGFKIKHVNENLEAESM